MNTHLLNDFDRPGAEFRGAPFWAWNGALDPDELRRQIRLMKTMGLGGFFMHSRVGLATPYLSDEWFRCVDACVDEARKQGLYAWIYDEDRWPSGAAGGLVTRDPQYRMRSLCLHVVDTPSALSWDRTVLAVFTGRIKDARVSELRPVKRGQRVRRFPAGHQALVFKVQIDGSNDWYNGFTYLDTLNPKAVRAFIRVTHDAYAKRYGAEFGKAIPGVFTDEPNHGTMVANWGGRVSTPWTDRLPQVFRRRYGYDLRDHLPELFYDVDGVAMSRARYHYHDCVTQMFVDAFTKQFGAWCGAQGVLATGHMLSEESILGQTRVVGSAMRHYEYMQAPGMDILTEHNREYDTAKQVSSMARQFGRKWRLTETYGCTGWDFPFAGHKAIGDWQLALGINLRCQHLSWYTMEGQAKRDYPAGIFYQSPWWTLYPKVEDYFARTHAVMTRGEEVRDLLVVHPVESAWTLCRLGWDKEPAGKELAEKMMRVRDSLLAGNVDFDYGDEEVMSRHARVARRKGRVVLCVGRGVYRAVLVPPTLTLRRSTLRLLREFSRQGGRVVFAGEPCGFVDAEASREVRNLATRCVQVPEAGERLVFAVEDLCRRVSIATPDGEEVAPALYLLREDREAFYLFVCNTGHDYRKTRSPGSDLPVRKRTASFPQVRVRGFVDCAGAPLEFDAEQGRVFQADAVRAGKGWEIRTSLPALASRVFVIPKGRSAGRHPVRPKFRTVGCRPLGARRWDVALSECNNLVLDRPAIRLDGGAWQAPQEVLKADQAVRTAMGIPVRGGRMKQPWAQERSENPPRKRLELAYEFEVKHRPDGDLFVAIERPELYEIRLNGERLDTDTEAGWWVDGSLRKVSVDPSVLRSGRNELTLVCDYSIRHPGLEMVYLLGAFGVNLQGIRPVLVERTTSLRLGDWVKQGLPFYSGHVAYRMPIQIRPRKGQRVFVEVPDYRGVAVCVRVNGQRAGVIGWDPPEVDITAFLANGRAELVLEVVGHRRNSHGPLHHSLKWPWWTGPGEYTTTGDKWQDDYQLVPCGLMKPPRLVVKTAVR
jgi:hypothetical protein